MRKMTILKQPKTIKYIMGLVLTIYEILLTSITELLI